MTDPASSLEVETKYDVLDRAAARALLATATLGPLRATGPAARSRLVDRYLDSADGRLRAAGWAARLRTVGSDSRIQLKELAQADAAGVARRRELDGEATLTGSPDTWPESSARQRLVEMLGGEPLIDILVLRQDRLARAYALDDGDGTLELSLDRIEVLSGEDAVGRRLVLEVEQQGASDSAFGAALSHIDGLGFLAPAHATKLGWGMEVAARSVGDDGLPMLAPIDGSFRIDDPTAEVGRTILATQLRTMIDRERVVRGITGPEEIRRLRVATRRARATLRAFENCYVGRRPDHLRRGLRRFARLLNDVRNLDVLIGHVDGYLVDLESPDRTAIESLRSTLEDRRAEALATLLADCASEPHHRLLAKFADFAQTPGSDVPPVWAPQPRRLSDAIGGWIWSGFESLAGWRPILDTADLEELHQMRLEVKRLRDLVLVVSPVSGPVAPVVGETLAGLQDALGSMNDAAVASTWLRGYLAAATTHLAPEEITAIDRLAWMLEDRIAPARARIPAAWRLVTGDEGRRRIARLIGRI